MRIPRASLLVAGLLLLTASVPVDAGTAARTRPSGGGGTASRPPGSAPSAPHRAQGHATWGYGYSGGYHHGGYYHGGWYGYPYWGGYWGWPYYPYAGWGWSVGWSAPYWGWGPGPVYAQDVEVMGNAFIETDVTPKRATVRLDGEDVGLAKDWNGVWDRLPIEAGTHVLEFVLDGHQTLQVHLDAIPGRVYHVRRELRPGEGLDPRSTAEAPRPSPRATRPESGYLSVSVEPADAAVYLDGRFVGRASDLRRLEGRPLPAGEHELEVVRPGFLPERTTVVVDPDDVREVRIALRREGEAEGGL